ncbi:glycosyltransferase, exosortase A system-associated [Alkalimonas collagenimarina]|uniref:Glycosyltransferase, exosortase A system-associated n=1 Tax=Alkalimonas collagenimarina TaxID=400390 RepID=A0ABT9GZD8_9GAMM|nr:TIGR04063 family PEP-CTERM/XrtA system glycosyltransferase [Alkalimonas collagenimarina]MDP4536383.1 glycosyltransferase, exosortase A system-associated [Alkalimonas collagenimarina]
MKVLHILEYSRPNISGYSLRSDAIIRHQRQLGIETVQLTSQRYQDFKALSEDVDGVTYLRTPQSGSLLQSIPFLNYLHHINHLAQRIEAIVKQEKPDLIQTHSPMFNALAAAKVGKKYNIPVTYEVRALWEDAAVDTGKTKEGSFKYRLIKRVEQMAFDKADAISCICEGLRQDLLKRGISPDKVFVTPNAVDTARFQQLTSPDKSLQQQLGLTGKKVIAFVGSYFKYEGLAIAIDAMTIIAKSRPDIHLLLVGGGNEQSALKQQAEQRQLTEHITFVDRVPFEEVSRYYSLADALIFPRQSIRLTELVTPLKPLEAMAQGKVVFASDIGGHRELIQHEKTGLLFQPDSAEALAESVLTYIDQADLFAHIIDNGLEFVRHERNWLTTAGNYLPVYRRLISGS